jgi:tryptophan synthase alpha chain
MSRLEVAFSHPPVFMPYYPVGYPTFDLSVDIIEALAKNGADLVEVGLAFSDPLADGPVIQHATQIALQNGVTTAHGLRAVAELRARGVTKPLVLMGYYNPLLAYGLPRLAAEAAAAGADGFIVPDLPLEESAALAEALRARSLPLIRMLAPTTPSDRAQALLQAAEGFVYLVSLTGVTGARDQVAQDLPAFVGRVRALARPGLPLCVGFGIATPAQAQAVGKLADGVIVGSTCVKTIGQAPAPVQAAAELAQSFKAALLG